MRKIAMIVLVLSISACTTHIEDLLPQDGPTMLEIYNGHVKTAGSGGSASDDVLAAARREAEARSSAAGNVRLDTLAYTRDAENEIDNLFPTLENPSLVMHVFPHLATDERLPVPGYGTSFPLFERVEFALPGEPAEPDLKSRPRIRIIGTEDG